MAKGMQEELERREAELATLRDLRDDPVFAALVADYVKRSDISPEDVAAVQKAMHLAAQARRKETRGEFAKNFGTLQEKLRAQAVFFVRGQISSGRWEQIYTGHNIAIYRDDQRNGPFPQGDFNVRLPTWDLTSHLEPFPMSTGGCMPGEEMLLVSRGPVEIEKGGGFSIPLDELIGLIQEKGLDAVQTPESLDRILEKKYTVTMEERFGVTQVLAPGTADLMVYTTRVEGEAEFTNVKDGSAIRRQIVPIWYVFAPRKLTDEVVRYLQKFPHRAFPFFNGLVKGRRYKRAHNDDCTLHIVSDIRKAGEE